MTSYPKSTMETFYFGKASVADEVDVVISDSRISISYRVDNGWVTYKGEEQGTGHYRVASSEVAGKGTLHRFGDEKLLEGSWYESGSYGTWRIELGDGGED